MHFQPSVVATHASPGCRNQLKSSEKVGTRHGASRTRHHCPSGRGGQQKRRETCSRRSANRPLTVNLKYLGAYGMKKPLLFFCDRRARKRDQKPLLLGRDVENRKSELFSSILKRASAMKLSIIACACLKSFAIRFIQLCFFSRCKVSSIRAKVIKIVGHRLLIIGQNLRFRYNYVAISKLQSAVRQYFKFVAML